MSIRANFVSLDTGCWILVSGCWLLVSGCYWLLVGFETFHFSFCKYHSAINGKIHVIQQSLTNCGFAKKHSISNIQYDLLRFIRLKSVWMDGLPLVVEYCMLSVEC